MQKHKKTIAIVGKNMMLSPCVFIIKFSYGFVFVVVYIDDLSILGTQNEIDDAWTHMNEKFEMKDFGKTKCYLEL